MSVGVHLEKADDLWLRIAAFREGHSMPEVVVEWAVVALADGMDSPGLRMLAGLGEAPNGFEVSEILTKTLAELKIEREDPKSARRSYFKRVCELIASEEVDPKIGLLELHHIWEMEYEAEYAFVSKLSDDLVSLGIDGHPLFNQAMTLENANDVIRADARTFAEGRAPF